MSATTPRSLSSWSAGPLRDFGDVLEVGILTLDAGLVVRGWNHWLEVASGRSAHEVVGRPLLAVFPELTGSPAEAAFRSALTGTTVMLSQRFHRYLLPLPVPLGIDGFDRMQQSARIVPLVREDAHLEGVLVLIQDVTERVAREEELRRAMQLAEEASRAKSDFLAAMSHDFRTPLGAIIGFTSLIEEEIDGPVSPLQKQHLKRVKSSAQHLLRLIEEVLAFATVEAGKETLHLEEFDAAALAREVGEMLESQAAERGVRLDMAIPEERVQMCSDVTKLRQILVNLVGNALKFTDEGNVALGLVLEAERVLISVRDTGPGIGPDNLERIFEPFTRLTQPGARSVGGTGLGLPVSRRLARLLGGDLVVESRQGEGSTFTLTLPRDSSVSAARERVPSQSSAVA